MEKTKAQNNYAAWYARNLEKAREQKRVVMKRLRSENPEKYAAQSRKAKAKERERLYEIYGHVCAICGFSDKRALTLDHRLNNGSNERKLLGERGVYRKAKASYAPEEYQILCMNCQFIKRVEYRRQNQHG